MYVYIYNEKICIGEGKKVDGEKEENWENLRKSGMGDSIYLWDIYAPGDSCTLPRYGQLSVALGRVLDDYSLVKFFPLDITNEENLQVPVFEVFFFVFVQINCTQNLIKTNLLTEIYDVLPLQIWCYRLSIFAGFEQFEHVDPQH